MASSSIQGSESTERVNSIGRIFGALFAPEATFESIARRPTWFPPLVLICLIALVIVGLFGHRVGWRSFFEKQIASNSRVQQMPLDQQERVLDMQLKYGAPYIYAIAAISPAVVVLTVAAAFLGIFNGLAGANLNFKTSLGIVAHAWMPGIISGLLGAFVIFVKDPSTLDLQNLVASNASIFLSQDSAKWLFALLKSIDAFTFWIMILLAIGYSAAAPKKLSFGRAFRWIFGMWCLVVLVTVGFRAAFS